MKLGVSAQYHPEPLPAITALLFAQSRKFVLKTFLKGLESLDHLSFGNPHCYPLASNLQQAIVLLWLVMPAQDLSIIGPSKNFFCANQQ